jgi:hypothetical protein
MNVSLSETEQKLAVHSEDRATTWHCCKRGKPLSVRIAAVQVRQSVLPKTAAKTGSSQHQKKNGDPKAAM